MPKELLPTKELNINDHSWNAIWQILSPEPEKIPFNYDAVERDIKTISLKTESCLKTKERNGS